MSNIIDSIQLSGTTYQIQGSGGGVPESAFTAYTAATDARIAEDEEVTAAALNELNEAISGVSGNNVVELTQAEYDALVSGETVDPTAFYIITDATAGDLTQYWTSAQTQSAITSATSGKVDTSTYNTYTAATDTALSGKQATLVNQTNIKSINGNSLLGSGNIDIQGGVTPQEFSAYTASTESRIAEDEEVTAAGLNAVNSALGGLKLQQITQSAYDALVTKDASTLYIITE